jgi:hypothetical protein
LRPQLFRDCTERSDVDARLDHLALASDRNVVTADADQDALADRRIEALRRAGVRSLSLAAARWR